MKRPLPAPPVQHDSRNQNETRRAIMQMLHQARVRLEALEAESD